MRRCRKIREGRRLPRGRLVDAGDRDPHFYNHISHLHYSLDRKLSLCSEFHNLHLYQVRTRNLGLVLYYRPHKVLYLRLDLLHSPDSPLLHRSAIVAHHVRAQSPHQILPTGLRSLEAHPPARSQASRSQANHHPPHGTLQYALHLLRRIHLQRPQVQRSQGDSRGALPRSSHLPLLHQVYTL